MDECDAVSARCAVPACGHSSAGVHRCDACLIIDTWSEQVESNRQGDDFSGEYNVQNRLVPKFGLARFEYPPRAKKAAFEVVAACLERVALALVIKLAVEHVE